MDKIRQVETALRAELGLTTEQLMSLMSGWDGRTCVLGGQDEYYWLGQRLRAQYRPVVWNQLNKPHKVSHGPSD